MHSSLKSHKMSMQSNKVLKTYQLRYETIQEFELPSGCICTSLSVNPVMGEIMFACRSNGLLHYRFSKETGVVFASEPCRISYGGRNNVRLVKCEQESGNYVVVNDQTLALVMIGYQRMTNASANPSVKISTLDGDTTSATRRAVEPHPHETAHVGSECVDFESQLCKVGDVRDVALDTENERIYLLYRDRLCRRIFPDMRHYSAITPSRVNRCVGPELVCLALGRKLIYTVNKAGDIKVRLKLERMTDTKDQLAWRTIGYRLGDMTSIAYNTDPMLVKQIVALNHGQRQQDANSQRDDTDYKRVESTDVLAARRHRILQDYDSTSSGNSNVESAYTELGEFLSNKEYSNQKTELVELASVCVDTRRNIIFAGTGTSKIYVMWQLNASPETGTYSWQTNLLEDTWLDLSMANSFDNAPPKSESFQTLNAGALACVSSSARRPGFLYVVSRENCRWVRVIRYTTEQATVVMNSDAAAVGGGVTTVGGGVTTVGGGGGVEEKPLKQKRAPEARS